jgi:hypothetical protein
VNEVGDLALAVGPAAYIQLADADEIIAEAGRIHESRLRGLQPGICRALHELAGLLLGVWPPVQVPACFRKAGEGMHGLAVAGNEIAQNHQHFGHRRR